MLTRIRRLAVVAFVVAGTACAATSAQATSWVTGLQASAKQAQAHAEAVPIVPTGVSLTCVASTQKLLKVTWNSVPHATYDVFYSTTSATTGFASAATGVAATTWTSATLPNATYWVQVSAAVGSWKSANSAAPASRTIRATAPVCS